MVTYMNRTLFNSLFALAIAFSFATASNVSSAEAGHKKYKKAAVIAGVIIGGAIAYKHYKKRKRYKKIRYGVRRYHKRHYGYHRNYRLHRKHYGNWVGPK